MDEAPKSVEKGFAGAAAGAVDVESDFAGGVSEANLIGESTFQVLSLPGFVALVPVAKMDGVLAPDPEDEPPKMFPDEVEAPNGLDGGLGVELSGFSPWG